jgi:hypothetical protein
MQETPTVEQPTPPPQPPMYPSHPYQEYAAVEQPQPAPQPPTYQQQPPVYPPPMYPPPTYPPPQQPVPPPKKKMSTGMKWLIVAVVILALGLVGGIFQAVGGSRTSVQPTPTQQATPAPTQNPSAVTPPPPQVTPTPSAEDNYKSSAKTMTIAEIVQAGDSSKNKIVHFQGMVGLTVTSDSGVPGAGIFDPSDSNNLVIVAFAKGTDLSKIHEGDTIEIWGMDAGMLHSGSLDAPGVMAKYFTDHTSGYTTP